MAETYDTTTPELTDEELQRLAMAPRKLDASLNGGLAPVVQPPEPEAPKVEVARASKSGIKYGPYTTNLGADEPKFQQWVKQNKVPWQDTPNADYDMRSYWKATQSGDPNARQAANGHFPDTYKTPYHKTFSNESKYATPDAPHWDGDRLIDAAGNVVADETPKVAIASPSAIKATTRTFTPAMLPAYAYPAGSPKANEADAAFKAKKAEEADVPKLTFSQPNPIEQTPQRPPISPLQQKTSEDSARLAYLQKSGSGIDQMLHPVDNNGVQIQNPHVGVGKKILAPLARIGDIAGSALLPGIMQRIPGTTEHHNLLVNQAAGRVASDYGQQKTEQEIASKEAEEEAKRTNAELVTYHDPDTNEDYQIPRSQYGRLVGALENAKAKADKNNQPIIRETDEGLVMVSPNTKEVTPLTLNGHTLMAKPESSKDIRVGERVSPNNVKYVTYMRPDKSTYEVKVGAEREPGKAKDDVNGDILSPADQALVDEIGSGRMALNRLDYILARNPKLLAAVSLKYPDFDSSRVKSYIDAYKSFTGSGNDAKQLAAGSVAIRHLKQLKDIYDNHPYAARTWGREAYTRYHNLLDTVADELMTFYGEPKTNEAIASKKATLGALFNRKGAIEEQAQAMGVKFDELEQKWHNAAPSQAYQAPMPGMSQEAIDARRALDPIYARRISENQQPSTPSVYPATPTAPSRIGITAPSGKYSSDNPYAPKH